MPVLDLQLCVLKIKIMAQMQTNLDSHSNSVDSKLTDQEQLDIKYENIQKSIKQHDEIVDEWSVVEEAENLVNDSSSIVSDLNEGEIAEEKNEVDSFPKSEQNENLCLSAELLVSIADDKIPHLWDPFFPKVGLVGICGASESGKSSILRQLCLAICNNNSDFLGSKLFPTHKNTLYISTEDNEISSGVILKSQTKLYPNSLKGAKFGFNLTNPLNFITKQFQLLKFDLVVIDVWSDLYGGSPNDFSKVRENLNKYSKLASQFQTCICIIHHNTKHSEGREPSKTNLNGSQAIEAKLRTLLEVRTDNDQETLVSVLKGNYIPRQTKKKQLVLSSTEDYNFSLKHIKERRFNKIDNKVNKSENPIYISRIKALVDEGKTQDRIVEILKKEFGNDAPGKGTVNYMIKSF